MLGWLSGIIDGEGTLTVCRCRNSKGIYGQIRPIIQVVNTNLNLLKECQKLFHQLTGTMPKIKSFNSGNAFKSNKQCYRIQITGYKRVKQICVALVPFLVAKKEQASLLIDLSDIREKRFRQTIGDDEEVISIAIRKLNKEPESVTTIRQTFLNEDIVWTNGQPLEVDRNSLPALN
jgi:sigma54-dependent transcription regulator